MYVVQGKVIYALNKQNGKEYLRKEDKREDIRELTGGIAIIYIDVKKMQPIFTE